MNRIETPKGVLKYRYPTVIENMQFLKKSKDFFRDNDPIGAKISIMENLEPMLDYSELEGISNFAELNSYGEEMTMPLSQIADDIMEKISEAFKKKN